MPVNLVFYRRILPRVHIYTLLAVDAMDPSIPRSRTKKWGGVGHDLGPPTWAESRQKSRMWRQFGARLI